MSDFTIKRGSYCPVCQGTALDDCVHTMDSLRNVITGDAALRQRLAESESRLNLSEAEVKMLRHFDGHDRLAEAEALLTRAEDDLSEWERIHGSDPQTTRLRLEIMGFRAADSASGEGEK